MVEKNQCPAFPLTFFRRPPMSSGFLPCRATAMMRIMPSYVVRLFVRLSVCLTGVTLIYSGHTSLITSKVILRINS